MRKRKSIVYSKKFSDLFLQNIISTLKSHFYTKINYQKVIMIETSDVFSEN